MDYYELLDIPHTADEKQIRRAFRKVSLKYHPDKNPSEDAKVKFHALQEALDTLLDEGKRKQYDNERNASILQRQKLEQKTEERRKMQQDLERREAEAKEEKRPKFDTHQEVRRKMDIQQAKEDDEDARTVKVSLRVPQSEGEIEKSMSKFGPVEYILVGKRTALVVFGTIQAAYNYKTSLTLLDKDYAKATLQRLRTAVANGAI